LLLKATAQQLSAYSDNKRTQAFRSFTWSVHRKQGTWDYCVPCAWFLPYSRSTRMSRILGT